jgi:hypothetical protein
VLKAVSVVEIVSGDPRGNTVIVAVAVCPDCDAVTEHVPAKEYDSVEPLIVHCAVPALATV